jgi:hypothetical protein
MDKRRMARILPLLLLGAGLVLAPLPCAAQDDYPLPQGNPETWGTGRTERLAVPPLPGDEGVVGSGDFTAPPPRGNLEQERPGAPAGEAEEVYTGTRPQGGITPPYTPEIPRMQR